LKIELRANHILFREVSRRKEKRQRSKT